MGAASYVTKLSPKGTLSVTLNKLADAVYIGGVKAKSEDGLTWTADPVKEDFAKEDASWGTPAPTSITVDVINVSTAFTTSYALDTYWTEFYKVNVRLEDAIPVPPPAPAEETTDAAARTNYYEANKGQYIVVTYNKEIKSVEAEAKVNWDYDSTMRQPEVEKLTVTVKADDNEVKADEVYIPVTEIIKLQDRSKPVVYTIKAVAADGDEVTLEINGVVTKPEYKIVDLSYAPKLDKAIYTNNDYKTVYVINPEDNIVVTFDKDFAEGDTAEAELYYENTNKTKKESLANTATVSGKTLTIDPAEKLERKTVYVSFIIKDSAGNIKVNSANYFLKTTDESAIEPALKNYIDANGYLTVAVPSPTVVDDYTLKTNLDWNAPIVVKFDAPVSGYKAVLSTIADTVFDDNSYAYAIEQKDAKTYMIPSTTKIEGEVLTVTPNGYIADASTSTVYLYYYDEDGKKAGHIVYTGSSLYKGANVDGYYQNTVLPAIREADAVKAEFTKTYNSSKKPLVGLTFNYALNADYSIPSYSLYSEEKTDPLTVKLTNKGAYSPSSKSILLIAAGGIKNVENQKLVSDFKFDYAKPTITVVGKVDNLLVASKAFEIEQDTTSLMSISYWDSSRGGNDSYVRFTYTNATFETLGACTLKANTVYNAWTELKLKFADGNIIAKDGVTASIVKKDGSLAVCGISYNDANTEATLKISGAIAGDVITITMKDAKGAEGVTQLYTSDEKKAGAEDNKKIVITIN